MEQRYKQDDDEYECEVDNDSSYPGILFWKDGMFEVSNNCLLSKY